MQKFGIDISRWQGDFDFSKAIAEGVEFVVVKGGGGDDGLYTDKKFVRNYNEAKAKGLPVGCYWFSKATTIEEAEKEAEYFYSKILKGRQFELPVYMDVEHKDMLDIGKDKLTSVVKAFCEKIEAYGYWVGIYSTTYWFNKHMNDSELQCYAHWVAQWAKECTYKGGESVLGMWQFGGETNLIRTNKVAGVTCDQNYMLLDYPSLIKNAGLNGFTKTTTTNKVEEKPKPETPKPETKEYDTYTVKKGDSLWAIAADKLKDGTRYNEIKKLNGLESDMIYAGQVLKLPTVAKTQKKKTYTVKKGDSLWKIAQDELGNGARYTEIKKLNGLKSDMIYAGQVLEIPAK